MVFELAYEVIYLDFSSDEKVRRFDFDGSRFCDWYELYSYAFMVAMDFLSENPNAMFKSFSLVEY